MSLVIEERRRAAKRRTASKPRARAKTAGRPVARTRVKTSRRPRSGAVVTGFAALACSLALSFVFFSVVGNTLLEQSRRDRLRSVERTKEAREEVARLRRALNSMTSMAAVDRWASANSFTLSGVEAPTLPSSAPAAPSAESRSVVAAMRSTPGETQAAAAVTNVMAMAPELVVEAPRGGETR